MSEKLERQFEIINFLSDRKRETYTNLAFELGVGLTTIKKDILDILDIYPINTFQGKNGGVELGQGFIIRGHYWKNSELELMTEGLNLLHNKNPENKEIMRLINKLAPPKKSGRRYCDENKS